MLSTRILYIILLLASFVFVLFYGGTIPYTIFFIFLLLPLASILYTVTIVSRFKYSQETDKKFIVKGDRINYSFTIGNEDYIFYPYLKVSFFGSDTIFSEKFTDFSLSLLPQSTREFKTELYCEYSGSFEIGAGKVVIEDFFGIYRFGYKIPFPLSITVYPRVVPLQNFSLKLDFSSVSLSKALYGNDESTTFRDVRKYSYGDSLKKVHWNLSAKLDEIMVRQFQNTVDSSALIIPDFTKNFFGKYETASAEDKISESAVSIANYCLRKNIPVTTVCYSEKLEEFYADDLSGFGEMYDCISAIRFSREVDYPNITATYTASKSCDTNLVIITADLGYELYDVLHKAVLTGFYTTVIYIDPNNRNEDGNSRTDNVIRNLSKIGGAVYIINRDDEIKSVLEAGPL